MEQNHHLKSEEYIAIFIAINSVAQLIGDVIVEILHLIPTRINHLSLTLLNAFIAFKTLSAIKKERFRFLHEDVQIMFLLELLLILGDIFYLLDDGWDLTFFIIRSTFILLSFFNLSFVVYIISKYELYHLTYQGETCRDNEVRTLDI